MGLVRALGCVTGGLRVTRSESRAVSPPRELRGSVSLSAGYPPQELAGSSAARLQPRFGIGPAGSASMRPTGCKSRAQSSQRLLPARALRPEPGTCRVTPAGATAAVPVPLSVFPKGLVVVGSAGAAKGCLQHKDQRGGEMEQVWGWNWESWCILGI